MSRLTERRFSFTVGDFVRFHDCAIGRIDGMFVVRLSTTLRLFFKLAVAQARDILDPILEIPVFRMMAQDCIVGLPGIDLSRPYLIPITSSQGNEIRLRRKDHGEGQMSNELDLLMIPWNVHYL